MDYIEDLLERCRQLWDALWRTAELSAEQLWAGTGVLREPSRPVPAERIRTEAEADAAENRRRGGEAPAEPRDNRQSGTEEPVPAGNEQRERWLEAWAEALRPEEKYVFFRPEEKTELPIRQRRETADPFAAELSGKASEWMAVFPQTAENGNEAISRVLERDIRRYDSAFPLYE